MKNVNAKIQLWLKTPDKTPMPVLLNLPPFHKKSFRSYEEMNAWKREYLLEIARNGGLKWKN